MSRYHYLETLTDGRQQYVTVKRTKSYHHHHHSHKCEYYKVRRDEWNNLVERCRLLEDNNRSFAADNDTLRSSLSAVKAEAQRLGQTVAQLQGQNSSLCAENQSLRRSLDNTGDHSASHRETDRLRHKIDRLEKENKDILDKNEDLRFRVHELSKQVDQSINRRVADLTRDVEYWKTQCGVWKTKYKDLRAEHISLTLILDNRTERMEAYADILKRRGILV